MSWPRRWLWPVPVLHAAVAGSMVAVAVLIHGWELIGWPVADWVRVSTEFHESLVLAGPLLAGCTAWTAGTFTGRNSLLCPAASTRSGYPMAFRQMAILASVALVGYGVGLAPILISTATRATSGGPDLLVLAGSVAALVVFVAVGYLAGAALPRSLGIVIAVAVSFTFALAAGVFGRSLLPVTPVWLTGLAVAGFHENPVLSSFRVFFFVFLTICCAIAAARWVFGRSPASLRASASGLLLLALPAALAVVTVNRPIDPLIYEQEPAPACDDADGVSICVHEAHAAIMAPLKRVVSLSLDVTGPAAAQSVERVVDSVLWPQEQPGDLVLSFQFQRGDTWANDVAFSLAGELSGATTCHALYRGTARASGEPDEMSVAQAVGQWIWTTSGYATHVSLSPSAYALFEELDALPKAQVRNWITDHHAQLQACDVSPGDMP